MNINNNIEILAPAGSIESLKAAVAADCDAVYIGGQMFGARAFANNLTNEQLINAIEYMHVRNKKLYLTVNTLLTSTEIKSRLFQYIEPLYKAGLDAVIIQDLGVMSFLHTQFPDLELHASTQMTITQGVSSNILEPYGVTRIVPSRELSIIELNEMRKDTKLELEVFVHGALCYCYSGQCLMSSMLGGRSGNRGKCAQPCRQTYQMNNKESSYLLSPKDLCSIPLIPQLCNSGIDSFKIEGRMKKPAYTAYTSHLYKKYLTYFREWGEEKYLHHFLNNYTNYYTF